MIYGSLEISPWEQKRGSHAESGGDSHNIGHHDVGDENEHHGEGHDPLGRVIKKKNLKNKVTKKLRQTMCACGRDNDASFPASSTRWHTHQSVALKWANRNNNSALTVIPQKAAVFFPNLCRNHCHSGMLITAETYVNKQKTA